MAVREGRKLDTVLWAVLMLAGGAMIYGGVAVINTAHTCDPYNGCSSSADAWLGFPLAFIGLGLLLYGYASFVKSWGAWRPYVPEKRGVVGPANFDPVKAARAEVQARFPIVALLGLDLEVVEAIPLYAPYQARTRSPDPTFDPVAFALEVGIFASATLPGLALLLE